jgi:hypothetical protein
MGGLTITSGMPINLGAIIDFLSAISSIAVVLGAIFVVFQLRQNSKMIALQITQNRSNIAVALLETLTSENFAERRKKMHDTIRKALASNWKDFDDSLEDYESRNFAYIYELVGQLAKAGVVDLEMLKSALQYLVVWDWDAFSPFVNHLMETHDLFVHPWEDFQWLAVESKRRMETREQEAKKRKKTL